MPAYHSAVSTEGYAEACGCALTPFRTEVRGPCPPIPADNYVDIIDDVLTYFRANVLFQNFEVKNGADRTMIYLMLFTVACLVKTERIEDKASAVRELRAMAQKQFAGPGEPGWPLSGILTDPKNTREMDDWKAYFKQARDELAIRLCERLFDASGQKSKWWQSFSKKKFMGKELSA